MKISLLIERLHYQATGNKWLRYFTIFNRLALAAGFIPSGMVKILGERFTSLSNNHPMGHYLEALYHTGYYYPFIGVLQVTAALLLLIPRTAVLGSVLYFPIILNICVLSHAVRFDGSLISSPLMVISNLYLLCWYYDRWKYILPFNQSPVPKHTVFSNKFPTAFFAGAAAAVIAVIMLISNVYSMKPYNTLPDCQQHCKDSENPGACYTFCDCIHNEGQPFDKSLNEYERAVKDTVKGK